jgi:hypothetical protein
MLAVKRARSYKKRFKTIKLMAHTDVVEKNAVPEFTGRAAEVLTTYYKSTGVFGQRDENRLAALETRLGPVTFYAYGGGETLAMKLRAAEYHFLVYNNIEIE